MVAFVRPLVALDHVAKHVMRIEKQMERLARRRPQHFTGRQVYVQQLSALAGHGAKSDKRVFPRHYYNWPDSMALLGGK